jgi:hypothetical protein
MRRLTIGALLLAAVTASCLDDVDPLPLDITMTASKMATVAADSISFVVNAQGNALLGIDADFGDGATVTQPTQGARTAKVTFRHAYTGIGTFQVTATVTDAVLGSKSASVQVSIQ